MIKAFNYYSWWAGGGGALVILGESSFMKKKIYVGIDIKSKVLMEMMINCA